MKRLRPFVNFNYDLRKNLNNELSAAQKNEITRYYNQVAATYGQPTIIYRPKKRANISAAKKASGASGRKFTAFPIASPTGSGRVRVTKAGIIIDTPGGTVKSIILDMRKLIASPERYLLSVTKPGPYYIINSKWDWNARGPQKKVISEIVTALNRYAWNMRDGEDDDEGEKKQVFPIYLLEINIRERASWLEYSNARVDAQYARTKRGKRAKRKADKKGR